MHNDTLQYCLVGLLWTLLIYREVFLQSVLRSARERLLSVAAITDVQVMNRPYGNDLPDCDAEL